MECRARAGPPRPPHLRRLTLALGQFLLGASLHSTDPLDAADILTSAQLGERTSPRNPRDVDDRDELVAYQSAQQLQNLVVSVLDAVNERTLDLTGLRDEAGELADRIEYAWKAARLMQDAPAPETRPMLDLPTPDQVHIWQERRELETIRTRLRQRADVAGQRCQGSPLRRSVTEYRDNGVFRCQRADGFVVDGWAETPDAVAEVLRDRAPGHPVELDWLVQPVQPYRRLPFGGRTVDDPSDKNISVDRRMRDRDPWISQPDSDLDAFAAAVTDLQDRWTSVDDLPAQLEQAAARLNETEPQAPSLGDLLDGSDDTRSAACTLHAGWIDPAAIAHTGTPVWNGFGEHRPGQCASFARALLTSTDHRRTAEQHWAVLRQPVQLYRVPGPAGPLYELGSNGMHRIHTARMLGFPLLWAEVHHFALPFGLTWHSLGRGQALTETLKRSICGIWRGLLDRDLVVGSLDEDEGVLELTWAPTPWLLAEPESAVLWARNYDRAYPGALTDLGIPSTAIESADTWRSWLH